MRSMPDIAMLKETMDQENPTAQRRLESHRKKTHAVYPTCWRLMPPKIGRSNPKQKTQPGTSSCFFLSWLTPERNPSPFHLLLLFYSGKRPPLRHLPSFSSSILIFFYLNFCLSYHFHLFLNRLEDTPFFF